MASDTANDAVIGAETRPMSFVKRWLVMPKLLYFMLNMYVYAFHGIMFLIVVEDWKFSWVQYALTSSVTVFNFAGSFVWPPLADKTGRYKTIISATCILYTICACILIYPFKLLDDNMTAKYLVMLVLLALFNFFLSAPFPLVDAQVMGLLVSDPRYNRNQFGNQRMFGCIGHFIATLLIFGAKHFAGKAEWKYDIKVSGLYSAIFQIMITVVFLLVVFFGIPNVKPVKAGHHGSHGGKKKTAASASPASTASTVASTTSNGIPAKDVHQVPLEETLPMAPTPAPPAALEELTAPGTDKVRHPIITLLTNSSFLMLMLFVIFAGIVRSVTATFVKPITHFITQKNLIMTASTEGTRVISEISIYFMAPFLKRHMGSYWILVMSQVVGVARMLGYWAVNPDVQGRDGTFKTTMLGCVFALELLKGLSSGLISSSAIAIASEIAPDGCEASAQGLYSGVYSGLSTLFAGLLGAGILKYLWRDRDTHAEHAAAKADKKLAYQHEMEDARGIQTMFMWVSIMTSVVTVAMAAKFIFLDRVMGLPGFPRRRQSLSH